MNIIAVDDENIALEGLKKAVLEAFSCAKFKAFQFATDALDYAKENPVDIAFVDIEMVEMNGIQFAKSLKKIKPFANIVFVTGYSEYMHEAIKVHCSGYIIKPATSLQIKEEIDNLIYEITPKKSVQIKTFGSFELLVDSKPVAFHSARAKEFLAILVNNKGMPMTRTDIASVFFLDEKYDRSKQQYLSKIYNYLKILLEEVGLGDLVIKQYNSYALDTSMIECDFWKYLEGDILAINSFHGEYMKQYSWAEEEIYKFYD